VFCWLECLILPVATAVTELKLEDGKVVARRELEGGYLEEVELPTPCVLTIQSGINEPRYVSIMGIKRAKSKEIKEVSVAPSISTVEVERMYLPPVKKAEMIEGDPSQIASKIVEILRDRGLI